MAAQNELHVIFGTGPVGAGIMRELVKQGKHVRMINRSGKPSLATGTSLPRNVEICAGDAYDPAETRDLAAGATVVYQAAQPEYHEWTTKFMPLQSSILDAAAAAGAKLVVVENLYMYGDPNGKPITEDMPINPNTRKGRVRAEMTQAVMAAHRSGKVRAVIGRASDFFGPAYMVMGDMVFYAALAGKAAQGIGNLDVPHTFTYTEDFGRALVILGDRDEALGQVWHVPSAPAITQREMLRMIFEEAGQPPKMTGVNRLMMNLAGLFVPGARETAEMMYEFEKPFILDSSRFTRSFGMTATPMRDAIRETVAWFRAHPGVKH